MVSYLAFIQVQPQLQIKKEQERKEQIWWNLKHRWDRYKEEREG